MNTYDSETQMFVSPPAQVQLDTLLMWRAMAEFGYTDPPVAAPSGEYARLFQAWFATLE